MSNKKYFVISDIHSFYDELMEALDMSGYDKDNQNHILIINGDIFDRGPKSKQVYNFIKSIPTDRRILIKGNHEHLFVELSKRQYPRDVDFQNGVVKTFIQFYIDDVNDQEQILNKLYSKIYWKSSFGYLLDKFNRSDELSSLWKDIVDKVNRLGIVEWLQSKEWVNYYEIDRFIITHSFIPLKNQTKTPIYDNFNYSYYLKYSPKWRTNATAEEWYEAVWGCPWRQYQAGLFKKEESKGKTLVVGHWHTSDFHAQFSKDYTDNTEIYYSKGIIAIDGGITAKLNGDYEPHKNVLVIENGLCYNKYRQLLKE